MPNNNITVRTGSNRKLIIDSFIASIDTKNSTAKTYRESISKFFDWLENTERDINCLGTADIVSYKKALLDSELSVLTVRSYIVAVHKFYQWAEGEGLYRDIARSVKAPRVSGGEDQEFLKMDLSEEESVRLLQFYRTRSPRDFALVNLMLRLGLRTIEVSRLNIGHIKMVNGQRRLQVWRKGMDKPNPKVSVAMPDTVWEPIRAYLETRESKGNEDPLFMTEGNGSHDGGRSHSGNRMSTRLIQMTVKKGLKEIGLDSHEYSAHSLRHTCAVMMLKMGASLTDIQRQLGHTSPNTTMIYLKSHERRIRESTAPAHVLDKAFRLDD